MIGFWWSDAARIYEGAAQLPRLRTQKATAGAWVMPNGPRPRLLADQVEDIRRGVSPAHAPRRGTPCW